MSGGSWSGSAAASEKEIPFPGAYVLSEGYISHTSNPARWARAQEMKMMYIMALAGPCAHIRALYKIKSLYQYINSNSQDSEKGLNARGWWLYVWQMFGQNNVD